MEPTEDTVEIDGKTLSVFVLTALKTAGPVRVVDATPLGIVGNPVIDGIEIKIVADLKMSVMFPLKLNPGLHERGLHDLYLCPEGWMMNGEEAMDPIDPSVPFPAICVGWGWRYLPEYMQPKILVEEVHWIYAILLYDLPMRDFLRGSPQMVGTLFADKADFMTPKPFQDLKDAEACVCKWCLSTQAVTDIREMYIPVIDDVLTVLYCVSEDHGNICHRAFANFWSQTEVTFEYGAQGFLSTPRTGIVVSENLLRNFVGLFKILYSDKSWVCCGCTEDNISPMQQVYGYDNFGQDCFAVLVDHKTREDILGKIGM